MLARTLRFRHMHLMCALAFSKIF
jgi:hypothetical protein